MTNTVRNHNDLIDDLIRQLFGVEPEMIASLAHDDAQVRLRLSEGETPTDPLDGLDVFARRIVAACVAMRRSGGAVSLVTERQARAAGWPTARLANMCLTLAWGLFIASQPSMALPVLIGADEDATGAVRLLARAGRDLPSYDRLIKALHRDWAVDGASRERISRRCAPIRDGHRLVSLGERLQDWLGVDATAVELPSDRCGSRIASPNARAACAVAWLAVETLDMGAVMQRERITAVRIKTDEDARLAGQPGAAAANLALLLGAAINHASGYTVHVLPPRDDIAADLVEAGRELVVRQGRTRDDREAEVVAFLEMADRAARGYVHVGQDAARRVAERLIEDRAREAGARAPASADEAAAPGRA